MDFSSIAAGLYLFFTLYSPMQQNLPNVLNLKNLSDYEEQQIKYSILSSINYEKNNDSDINIEDEYEAVLLDDLENPLIGPQSESSSIADNEEEKSAAEVIYKNSKLNLRLFEYGQELSEVYTNKVNQKNILSVNDKTITRCVYDDNFNLLKKTVWENKNTVKDSALIKETFYTYKSENSTDDSGKSNDIVFLYSVLENLISKNKKIYTKYDINKNPVETSTYSIETQENSEGKKITNEVLESSIKRSFDNQNRLVIDIQTVFYDKADPFRKGVMKRTSSEKKSEYNYSKKFSKPDLMYYENNVLRLKDEYLSEDSHQETLYFDNDYVIKNKYEHGRKVREIVYINNQEVRRRHFE